MENKKRVLKLGTRRSLLAWAQSQAVAREIEKVDPTVAVELVGIETRGDQIQNISLQKVEGKDFFVAELDQALLQGRVDMTVHSLKDLSLERPQELATMIPKRANPRDGVLFGPRALERLQNGKELRVGTSSPRRLENIPQFLAQALPWVTSLSPATPPIQPEFVEIRGNVNTRLSRVHEPEDSAKYLDGVVLAFAGLIRLWADTQGRAELQKLLRGVRWMVLPLDENPAAPGQGALAVECRKNDPRTLTLLNKLHDPLTAHQISRERQLLADWGGGCHQRFGATAIESAAGELLWVKGVKPSSEPIRELRWNAPQKLESAMPRSPWDGSKWRLAQEVELEAAPTLQAVGEKMYFVAHSRAVHSAWVSALAGDSRVWTSGTASWFKLAQKGIWVEGCGEGLGFDALLATLLEPVLQLPTQSSWTILTHSQGLEEWEAQNLHALATYEINLNYGESARAALRQATDIFWSSGSQINELKGEIPRNGRHACGPGKTGARLRALGLEPQVFPNREEWKRWINQ